jgi:hypothetical protein
MLTHQAQLVFYERVFHFHNLHSLSPLRGNHKKIAGLYRFLQAAPYPFSLTGIKQSD